MIIVTGAAGFIGSNLVRTLNDLGRTDLILVDHLNPPDKFTNLEGCNFCDYYDKSEFATCLGMSSWTDKIEAIFHQGACSDTMQHDGCYMMSNNFSYSKLLLAFALSRQIPFVYASSAAVYGGSHNFDENAVNEKPLNVYGFSKLAFDIYVRQLIPQAQSTIVGLRYFNVYGPNERHKGRMASCIYQFASSLRNTGVIKMFEGSGGYGPGEQIRDFVHVSDIVNVNLYFGLGPARRGIFNVGTGRSRTFNEVGRALIEAEGLGEIEYIPFPSGLKEKYQNHTQADLQNLRKAGYSEAFLSIEEGIRQSHAGTSSTLSVAASR